MVIKKLIVKIIFHPKMGFDIHVIIVAVSLYYENNIKIDSFGVSG